MERAATPSLCFELRVDPLDPIRCSMSSRARRARRTAWKCPSLRVAGVVHVSPSTSVRRDEPPSPSGSASAYRVERAGVVARVTASAIQNEVSTKITRRPRAGRRARCRCPRPARRRRTGEVSFARARCRTACRSSSRADALVARGRSSRCRGRRPPARAGRRARGRSRPGSVASVPWLHTICQRSVCNADDATRGRLRRAGGGPRRSASRTSRSSASSVVPRSDECTIQPVPDVDAHVADLGRLRARAARAEEDDVAGLQVGARDAGRARHLAAHVVRRPSP